MYGQDILFGIPTDTPWYSTLNILTIDWKMPIFTAVKSSWVSDPINVFETVPRCFGAHCHDIGSAQNRDSSAINTANVFLIAFVLGAMGG